MLGCCECGDEPSGSGVTELVTYIYIYIYTHICIGLHTYIHTLTQFQFYVGYATVRVLAM
jgi:uncharacterized protein (DUF983 family)